MSQEIFVKRTLAYKYFLADPDGFDTVNSRVKGRWYTHRAREIPTAPVLSNSCRPDGLPAAMTAKGLTSTLYTLMPSRESNVKSLHWVRC